MTESGMQACICKLGNSKDFQKFRETGMEQLLLWTLRGSLDLQPPELGEKIFLLFQATRSVVHCYSSLRKHTVII